MYIDKYVVKGLIFLCILFIITFTISFLPFHDPLEIDLDNRFLEPSLQHLWGTDDLGRDVLSRVLHGFSTTLRVSIFALLASLGIGIFFGGIAGYFYRTWIDRVFNPKNAISYIR